MHDQAVQLVEKFLTSVGWPKGYDANQAALHLAQTGMNLTGDPMIAFQWLYDNTISGATRNDQPWGAFGMLKDDYTATVQKLNSVMTSWTGNALDAETLKSAIRFSWTPDEVRNFATYGNPEGTGTLLPQAQLSGTMPWLSQGETYTQALQGFQAFEDHLPSDKATLAAWFRFGVSAKQLGGGSEAVGSVAPKSLAVGQSEIR